MNAPIESGGDAVLVGVDGHAGRITLNRPETLNALTLEMVRLIDAALDGFEQDPSIAHVIIDAAGHRAFCAGGDIRAIYDAALSGEDGPLTFWAEEYRLDARIARFAKPVVTIADGIVMGGGVGISAHASHRVVTERTSLAMPEVGIGFAPDVGGTWLLSRAPGETGTHIALTAGRLNPADALYAGFADHHVPSIAINALIADLAIDSVAASLARHITEPAPGALKAGREWIDVAYRANTVADIIDNLRKGGDDAGKAATQILGNSPTSVTVALEALRRGRELTSLEECLEMEYRISATFFAGSEFVEGIRAAVVDKDRNPRWDPPDLAAVTPDQVASYFAPRPDDLDLASHERSHHS